MKKRNNNTSHHTVTQNSPSIEDCTQKARELYIALFSLGMREKISALSFFDEYFWDNWSYKQEGNIKNQMIAWYFCELLLSDDALSLWVIQEVERQKIKILQEEIWIQLSSTGNGIPQLSRGVKLRVTDQLK